MKKALTLMAVIAFVGLWLTRPEAAVIKCEQINTPQYCEILERE